MATASKTTPAPRSGPARKTKITNSNPKATSARVVKVAGATPAGKTPAGAVVKKVAAKKTAGGGTNSGPAPASSSGARHKRPPASAASRAGSAGANLAKGAGAKASARVSSHAPTKVLLGEFLGCLIVLGLGTIVAPHGSADGVPRMLVKGSGLCALFLVLSFLAAGGSAPAKVATGFGGLITLAYVMTSSDAAEIARWMKGYFSPGGLSSLNSASS